MGEILRTLCECKGVNIPKAAVCLAHAAGRDIA